MLSLHVKAITVYSESNGGKVGHRISFIQTSQVWYRGTPDIGERIEIVSASGQRDGSHFIGFQIGNAIFLDDVHYPFLLGNDDKPTIHLLIFFIGRLGIVPRP